jgi:hypothetical protein
MCNIGGTPVAVHLAKKDAVYGYREVAFVGKKIKGSFGAAWGAKAKTATCRNLNTLSARIRSIEHLKDGNAEICGCGIYMNWKNNRTFSYSDQSVVLVKMWGWVVIGAKGARGEHCEMLAIMNYRDTSTSTAKIKKVAENYDIGIIPEMHDSLKPEISMAVVKVMKPKVKIAKPKVATVGKA